MGRFKNGLSKKKLLILDGALGTELEQQGYDVSGRLWSAKYLLKNPSVIQALHEQYLRAGSDLIITSSYQATIPAFLEAGYHQAEAYEFIKKTVDLAKHAVEHVWEELSEKEKQNRLYPLVAGSVGPYAAYLSDGSEYTGDYHLSKKEFQDFHRPRIQALLEAGSDLLAIETIPNGREAEALLDLLAQEFPQAEATISFTAQIENSISDGTSVEKMGQLADENSQILAIGFNCTAPHLISPLLQELQKVSKKPFIVYPNSGEVYDIQRQAWRSSFQREKDLLENCLLWQQQGARLIGGCCRTRPEDIQLLAEFFK